MKLPAMLGVLALLASIWSPVHAEAADDEGVPTQAAKTSLEVQHRRAVTGKIMGWTSPAGWVLGLGVVTTSFAVGYSSEDGSNAAPFLFLGLGTMGLSRLSATTGSALLASSSLRGAQILNGDGATVGQTAGWVALGGAAAQVVALAGQVAAPRTLEPHALYALMPGVNPRGARYAGLGMLGWGTSMVAGTIQHRQNVRAAGPRLGATTTPARVKLALVPTGNGVTLAGTF